MDLEVVEKEVASWAPEEQDRLATFLTVLRLKRTPDHVQELTRRREAPGTSPARKVRVRRRRL